MKLTIKILKEFLKTTGLSDEYMYYWTKPELISYVAKHGLENELKSYLRSL